MLWDDSVCAFAFDVASCVPGPSSVTFSATCSTSAYKREHSAGSMLSFTLAPSGDDRSTMSRHFPWVCFFVMTPILLVCMATLLKPKALCVERA